MWKAGFDFLNAFDDSGIKIKNRIAVYKIGTVRRRSSD